MEGLIMKYFVVKPRSSDIYGEASRRAMLAYAHTIKDENPEMSTQLKDWVNECDNSPDGTVFNG